MGPINLELRCSKSFHGLTADPEPDWSLDAVISDLNALEMKLNESLGTCTLLRKTKFLASCSPKIDHSSHAFAIRVSDDEMEDIDSSDEQSCQSSTTGRRFACDELDLSDTEGSEDQLDLETTDNHLMDKGGPTEAILFELEREHHLRVKEEVRNKFYALEADLRNENERSASALLQVEKCIHVKREMDKKLDKQYQRKIAEALDVHLSAVQRDHEQISLIELRRIRNDAASEEARRKGKVLLEEKMREKARAEAEARLKAAKVDEEMQKAALHVENTAKESVDRAPNEANKMAGAEVTQKEVMDTKRDATGNTLREITGGNEQLKDSGSDAPDKLQLAGRSIKSAETALQLEAQKLGKHKEVAEMNNKLRSEPNKDFLSFERQIARRVKQISGTQESLRAKASDILKIISGPFCPQSISIAVFAKQVVALSENPSGSIAATAFACGRLIVLVTSQVPIAMDLVLAEFYKACIYTVPKHICYTESAYKTKEEYYKAIGYQDEDGKLESTAHYLERVECCMSLYAALIQTEISGVRNLHGLTEGWAWLARFLNTLPAEPSTAVALLTFIRIAGFMLFRKYKSQFKKILNVISSEFLVSLKARKDPQLNQVVAEIEIYIETNQYLQEPQGWRLQASLLSKAY